MTTTSKKLKPTKLYAPVSNYFSIATIFRPLRRGHARTAFVVTKDTPTYTLEIKGWEELDAYDLDVFLGVLHLAGKNINVVEMGTDDLTLLNAKGAVHPSHFDTCSVTFSRYELLALLGKGTGKKEYIRLRDAIIRLAEVNFKLIYKSHQQWMSSNLWAVSNTENDITITLNRELGVGLVNNYSRVWFQERQELSNAGRILHLFLSGAIREGNEYPVTYPLDTLVEYVYGTPLAECNTDQVRNRRKEVEDAMELLSKHWPDLSSNQQSTPALKQYTIKRPSIPLQEDPQNS